MIKTDVCIIGAGPSGASTSLTLSKMKIPHYIIDKSTFPRNKTCGDGLILYAYKALRLIDEGLFDKFLNHPKFIHSKNIKLHVNNNVDINFKESKDRNMVITYAKRFDFDDFLVKNISDKYASFDFGNGVKNITELKDGVLIKLKDGKEILSKIVIGADGVNSIVSRKLAGNKLQKNLTSTFVNGYFK
ncbi:FAD-dependent monooxygenase, partial [Polaribacter sp.]|uniref:FAD-dependent monooxygenase n=1 Tax=Polaribacter sp. TaxID=1920175 RepID=UPI0035C7B23B